MMSPHPAHGVIRFDRAFEWPEKPARASLFAQWMRQWRCKREGGHWWHPDYDRYAGFFCCQCGAQADYLATRGEWS